MADNLKDFFISIGFAIDAPSQAKVETAAAKTEAKITASNIAEAAKRIEADRKVNEAKIAAAAKTNAGTIAAAALTGKTLTDDEKKLVVEQDKLRQEQDKKARDRREKSLKEWQAASVKVAAVVTGIVTALEAVAVGVLYAADKAAQGFEQLHYSARLAGTSAQGLNAFTYAAQQTGASVQEAGGSLDAFGKKLAKFPTYAEGLEKLGVKTKDANGHLLDSVDIATNLGDRLREIKNADPRYGLVNALNRSSVYGLDENTTRAIMDPEFRQRVSEYRKDHPSDDDAAKSGTDFEKSMRNFKSSVDGITTEFEDKVLKNLVPALDGMTEGVRKLSDYLHSKDFQDNLKAFEDEIGQISNAIKKVVSWITGANFDADPAAAAAAAEKSRIAAVNEDLLGTASRRHGRGWFGLPTERHTAEERKQRADEKLARFKGSISVNTKLSDLTPDQQKQFDAALAQSEGGPGSLADRNNNPGNLKFVGQDGAVMGEGGFAKFSTKEAGLAAMHRQIFGSSLYAGMTIDQAMAQYTKGDNSPGAAGKAAFIAGKISPVGGGAVGSGDAAGIALGMRGFGEAQSAQALQHIMHAGQWCADFVNGVIKRSGGQGSGSAAASSFANWGKAVGMAEVHRNDVILENSGRGTKIHHVGLATGEVQRDKNGNITAIEMVSGNYGHMVKKNWESPDIIAGLRRGNAPSTDDAAAPSPFGTLNPNAVKTRSPFGTLNPDAFKTRAPLGITPSVQSSIDNSRTRGDTNVTHNPTFTINGIQKPEEVASAVKFATSRSQSDLIRYMAGAVQ